MLNTLKQLFGFGPKVNYKELIDKGAVILDVRTKGEFSGGHAKGAVNIPLDQLGNNIGRFKNKDQVIITCCASGMRSASAKSVLKNAGFSQVYNGGSWYNMNRYTN